MYRLEESINDKYRFKALFVIGTGGSGKSFVVSKFNNQIGAKVLNSDTFFERGLIRDITGIQEFRKAKEQFDKMSEDPNFKITPDIINRPDIQEFRNTLVRRNYSFTAKNWFNGMLPIILDTTGAKKASLVSKTDFLRSLGYDVACLYVYVDVDTAIRRNQMRPRELPSDMIITQRNRLDQNLEDYQNMFADKFFYYDNSYDLRKPENREHMDELNRLSKQLIKFFEAPVENPIGQEVIETLTRIKGKYYEDYMEDFFSRADNVFQYKGK